MGRLVRGGVSSLIVINWCIRWESLTGFYIRCVIIDGLLLFFFLNNVISCISVMIMMLVAMTVNINAGSRIIIIIFIIIIFVFRFLVKSLPGAAVSCDFLICSSTVRYPFYR